MLYLPERMVALRICFYDSQSTTKANAGILRFAPE